MALTQLMADLSILLHFVCKRTAIDVLPLTVRIIIIVDKVLYVTLLQL